LALEPAENRKKQGSGWLIAKQLKEKEERKSPRDA